MAEHAKRRGAFLAGVLALGLSSGCGVEFDSVSQVDGLRVMGVKKSDSYAQPGDEVTLNMLYHDTGLRGPGDAEGEPRDLTLFWLAGCENPPGDLYALCIEGFARAFSEGGFDLDTDDIADLSDEQREQLAALSSAAGFGIGFEEDFSFTITDDIVARKPPSPDPGARTYGLSIVFFAACAGELTLDFDDTEFPMACRDEDGNDLGPRDFVAGYTSIFSYEGLSNGNPTIEGIEIDGERVPSDQICIGAECETLPPDPDRECSDEDIRIERCPDADDSADCDTIEVMPLVDPGSVERDVVTERGESRVEESMWVNFHTDRGKWLNDVALVNGSLAGFNDSPTSEYIGASVAGPAHLWVVVRDSRGGTEWARVRVCVED